MVHKIEQVLDTRDKRYMFIKLLFPAELPLLNLDGTPREAAMNMVDWFINRDLICIFEKEFFKHF